MARPEVAERLSVAGTPAECAEKIRTRIAPVGVNHVLCAVTGRHMARVFTGRELDGVADVNEQLRLISEQIMPAVRGRVPGRRGGPAPSETNCLLVGPSTSLSVPGQRPSGR
ncbi:hypothetical protein [Streptomyces sp. NPDC006274]|uniref:hypothetical protein n=1 Tax=unclassified Streptomyces TaxID=2593676 RepID=UPI0033A44D25